LLKKQQKRLFPIAPRMAVLKQLMNWGRRAESALSGWGRLNSIWRLMGIQRWKRNSRLHYKIKEWGMTPLLF
jgi:hypothetical protein